MEGGDQWTMRTEWAKAVTFVSEGKMLTKACTFETGSVD